MIEVIHENSCVV